MTDLKTPSVPALENGLRALELLAQSKSGLSLAEMTRQLSIPKSTAHCLLLTLERCGYLHRNERNRYLFGLKLFSLANMALSGLELREKAAPFLKSLMARTRLTAHLAVLENQEAVLIDKAEPIGVLKLATWLGKRMEVHCTGLGKALIAWLPEEDVDALVRERGLPRHNDNTISSARRLKEDLARVRKQGYALDDEEDEIGARCISAPVLSESGKVLAAVSVSGNTLQIGPDNINIMAERVKECAASIASILQPE
jgi:DNA-binding IclR family transcriptional regulator